MKDNVMKNLKCFSNPEEFPKFAKEMGFSFHLRRGRVNWHKIDAIDVDKLIQERDLGTLQENLVSIINYSLDAEYDVKILDPSFVKLFKLAQLAIDYLMYSEQHVYNCVQLAQDEIIKLSTEVQKLRKECKAKDLEQKNLRKKMKDLERLRPKDSQQLYTGQVVSDAGPHFQCRLCGKVFRTAVFLELHHGRRHGAQPSPTAVPDAASQETERLQLEVKELKERLNLAEQLLLREKERPAGAGKVVHVSVQDDEKNWEEESKRRMEEWQQNEHRKYREEFEALQKQLLSEIQRAKQQPGTTGVSVELAENVQKQEEKLSLLQEELGKKLSPGMQELQSQLSAQEQVWRSRLGDLERQHRMDLEELASRLQHAQQENAAVISVYESRIQSLTAHMKDQDVTLRAQGDQIKMLTTSHTHVSTALEHVSRQSVGQPPPTQSSARRAGRLDVGDRTSVRPFPSDQASESPDSSPSSPAWPSGTTVVMPARAGSPDEKQSESVHSSRDSGLESPKRAAPREAGLAMPHREVEETEGSDVSTSEGTSEETSGSGSQREEDGRVVQVPSLQEALALNPNILTELKGDLRDILERRLRELGVDPEWQGIPAATFRQKMSTVKHHQNITAKRYKNFFDIKKSIVKELEGKVAVSSRDAGGAAGRRLARPSGRSRSLTKMMGNVRSKALGILQRSGKSKHARGRSGLLAQTTRSGGFIAKERNSMKLAQVSGSRTLTPPREGRNTAGGDRMPAPQHRPAPSRGREMSATVGSGDFVPEVTVVTSTPVKTSHPLARPATTSILKSADQDVRSSSPLSSLLEDDGSGQSGASSLDLQTVKRAGTGRPAQNSAASSGSLGEKRAPSGGFTPTTEIERSISTPRVFLSAGSPTKVMVDDRSKEAGPTAHPRQKPARTVKFSDEIRPQLRKDVKSDSDWGISSDDDLAVTKSDHKADTSQSQTIRLSTRQSDKIAQISKNIEHQLNVTRKKPTGGVEAMFSAGDSSTFATTAAEKAATKPRALGASLSDWDLEDFEEFTSN